jgi:hypothetical protein
MSCVHFVQERSCGAASLGHLAAENLHVRVQPLLLFGGHGLVIGAKISQFLPYIVVEVGHGLYSNTGIFQEILGQLSHFRGQCHKIASLSHIFFHRQHILCQQCQV